MAGRSFRSFLCFKKYNRIERLGGLYELAIQLKKWDSCTRLGLPFIFFPFIQIR